MSSSPPPFALSNAAHPPLSPVDRKMSPKIARALSSHGLVDDVDEQGAETVKEQDGHRMNGHAAGELQESQEGAEGMQTTDYFSQSSMAVQEGEEATPLEDEEMLSPTSFDHQQQFRARPLPATHAAPSIQPRLSRTAALRMGITLPSPSERPSSTTPAASSPSLPVVLPKSLAAPSIAPRGTRTSVIRTNSGDSPAMLTSAKERRQSLDTSARSALSVFDGVPGHRRRESMQVASTMAPKIAPRLTKAAMLRSGSSDASSPNLGRQRSWGPETPTVDEEKEELADGPVSPTMTRQRSTASTASIGSSHGRRASIQVASTARPKTEPRLTKAAMLRAGIIPDSSTLGVPNPSLSRQRSSASMVSSVSSSGNGQGHGGNFEGVPGHKRRESIQVASTSRPKTEPRLTKAAMLRAGIAPPESVSRPTKDENGLTSTFEGVPGHRRRESIAVASLSSAPSIAPRLNRSAMLRQGSDSSLPPARPLSRSISHASSASVQEPSPKRTVAAPAVASLAPPKEGSKPRLNKAAELRQKEQEQKRASLTGVLGEMRRN